MSVPIRKVHLTRTEDAEIRERTARQREEQGLTAIAEAIRAHNTDQDYRATENQWAWVPPTNTEGWWKR